MNLQLDYQEILIEIAREVRPHFGKGKVANYIPILSRISPNKFGMSICLVSGQRFHIGDAFEKFSIQSISKVFMLTLAMRFIGDKVWHRVGKEPSGSSFNSLVQLEYENGIPRNPFINAGALVLADAISMHCKKPREFILGFVKEISGDQDINFDYEVAKCEKETGFRNAALANFLKSFNNLDNEVETVLDLYFHQCSLAMSCSDLACSFSYLANKGYDPVLQKQIIDSKQARCINAVMQTCGLYDAVGDFAYRVGLPGKSGVGGGIIAIIPNHMSICVWSPELNQNGNSEVGIKALELFTEKTKISIF